MSFQKELQRSFQIHDQKTAIEYADGSVSYAELMAVSKKVTQFILDKNWGPEVMIGLYIRHRYPLIYSVIGILNARCVFIPLNESLPSSKLVTMVDDLGLKYIISSRNSAPEGLEGRQETEIFFIEDIVNNEVDCTALTFPEYDLNDSIYVYFTSGSTGIPKGILGKNASLVQFIRWEIHCFKIDQNCRFGQLTSPYFDAFLRDIFVPIIAGGTICIPPDQEDFYAPVNITAWINKCEISFIHCVPSLFRLINNEDLSLQSYSKLRYVFLSGEKIIPSELKPWYDIFGSRVQLVNFYGATETTMIRSYYKISLAETVLSKIPVGFPIADTDLIILNKERKRCNKLIAGEIYISSDYITKGYLNAPELTHDKFVKLAIENRKDVPAFKTGDKGRLLPNGAVELLGREDRQVKLRGIRVELDEVETVLMKHDLIKNAVVIKDDRDHVNENLIAFLVKKDQNINDLDFKTSVKLHLLNNLIQYMIPANFVVVDHFPLLSNGKINYKELLTSQPINNSTVIDPSNSFERRLLGLWIDVLGDKTISVDDNFQSIGGNSLTLMRLIGKIYQEFSVRISLSELFDNQTIIKQAKIIEQATVSNEFLIVKADTKDFYNISSAQERIYYQYVLNKNSVAYNMPMAWEIKGAVDKDRIENAVNQLIKRHESLRTAFSVNDDRIVQVIKTDVDFKIEIAQGKISLEEAMLAFVKPFDLSQAPLIRCCLVTDLTGKNIFIVDLHHIICDGVSQINLFSDFLKFYYSEDLEPLNNQYKDYAEWEYQIKSTNEYLTYRSFWLNCFEDEVPKLDLPVINSDITLSHSGGAVSFKVDKVFFEPIFKNLEKQSTTGFSTLFSIFYIFLVQLTGQDDIVIGVTTSGRTQVELDGLVGMFVKTLPIRYRLNLRSTFVDFAVAIGSLLAEANSKQLYDLLDTMGHLNSRRSTPLESLFDVMLVFQNYQLKNGAFEKADFEEIEIGHNTPKYPLTLFASEDNLAFHFQFVYLSTHFTKSDIEILISAFKELIADISGNPYASIFEYIDDSLNAQPLDTDDFQFDF